MKGDSSLLDTLSRHDNIALEVITDFACHETQLVFHGERSRKLPPDIQITARRKLEYLHRARTLSDLLAPPGNRLEALKGDRAGQHSIRINDRWRICFVWGNGNSAQVQIVDYH